MDELQTGVEPAFAVLPQPPILLQPREAAPHHPALGHHAERVQFAPLGNLHRHMHPQHLAHALRKGFSHVAAVAQYALRFVQVGLAALECGQCSLAVGHLCCRARYRMRQPLRVHRDVAFDARDFLPAS